jgi:hypothetical protein
MRSVILDDFTNTHFEGVCAQNPKAKHGKNKQRRSDCRQVWPSAWPSMKTAFPWPTKSSVATPRPASPIQQIFAPFSNVLTGTTGRDGCHQLGAALLATHPDCAAPDLKLGLT